LGRTGELSRGFMPGPAHFVAGERFRSQTPCVQWCAVSMHHSLLSLLVAGAFGCAGGATPRPNEAPAPSPSSSASTASSSSATAAAELDEGERMIEVAAGDCAAACSGLARIEGARAKACTSKSAACKDAQTREADAKKRVKSFCGECGGP